MEERARQSLGASDEAIYAAAAKLLSDPSRPDRGVVVDVGCGAAAARRFIEPVCREYIGVDVVRYDSFPSDASFVTANLDNDPIPLQSAIADVVLSLETIEHMANPRRFVAELVRIAKPGGRILISTPNQLSFLSLLALVFKDHFAHFLNGGYPAHISALVPLDLVRMFHENEVGIGAIVYSGRGRIPGTARHYPRAMSSLWPKRLSDNVLVLGMKR